MICAKGCIYRDPDGTCQKFTDDTYHSFCVDCCKAVNTMHEWKIYVDGENDGSV